MMSRVRNIPPAIIALIGGLAGVLACLRVYNALPVEERWTINILLGGYLLLFAGAAASIYGFRWMQSLLGWVGRLVERSGQLPIQWVLLTLGVMAALTASMATGTDNLIAVDFWVMLIGWLAGMVLVALGAWKPGEMFPKASRRTWLLCAGLFVVGFAIRVVDAGNIPPLLNGDEASAGLSALHFIEDGVNNLFGLGWFSFPAMYYAILSLFIRLFGQTTFALRVSSALIGALTVPAVYLVGKRFYSHRAGLLAAIFLAGSHFHQHFSRIGLNNIWDAFWYVLVLGLLVDGWRKRRRQSYILAGLGLGLAQFFYVSARYLFLIIPVWLLLVVITGYKRWKGNRANLVYFVLVFLVVMAPSIWYFVGGSHTDSYLAPFNRVDILGDWLVREVEITGEPGWQIIVHNLYDSARTFVSKSSEIWYPAKVPILRPVSAVLFIAGLILILFQIRKPVSLMLLVWLGMFVVGGGFSVPISAAQRYVAALPACALVIGFSLDEILRLVQRAQEKRAAKEDLPLKTQPVQRWLTTAAILLVVGIGISNVYFYFFTYTPRTELGGENTLVAQRLADYLQTQGTLQVAFFGGERMGYTSINSTAYLVPQAEGLDFWEPWGSPENPPLTGAQVAFVFLPEVEENFQLVRQDFPEGDLRVELDEEGDVLYYLYLTNNPTSTN
ncbi:glycosyltransferase family 39 protein [bacterium]|nr:glycosyltransferase family 39 protein [bacterium]MCB2178978.1 glycosyltransferase family 39 protein [bacterium]